MQIGNYGYSPYVSRAYSPAPARCCACPPQPAYQPSVPSGPVGDPRAGGSYFDRGLRSVFQATAPFFPQGNNAVGQLAGNPNNSTLVSLLGNTGLIPAAMDLEKQGPVTILAPSNAAFEKLSQENPALFRKLTDPANEDALKKILLYHVSEGSFGLRSGAGIDSLQEADGARFFGNPYFGRIQNGDQTINTGTARLAANGSLVIPVDQVLIPPDFDPSTLK